MKQWLTIILLLLHVTPFFGQNTVSDIFDGEYNLDFFRQHHFRKIVITKYFSDNKARDKFKRGDKVVYIYRDSLIEYNWLKSNDKPLKSLTAYYKQDSLGRLYTWDKKYGALKNKYEIKDSLLLKDSNYEYTYTEDKKIRSIITCGTILCGRILTIDGTASQFTYYGDTLIEQYTYRYISNPANKYRESIIRTWFRNNIKYMSATDVYDYKDKKYVTSDKASYQVLQTPIGMKAIITRSYYSDTSLTLIEFLY